MPRGIVRLRDWLAGRARTPRAAYAAQFLRPGLGASCFELVTQWTAELAADSSTVLSHGSAGLGSAVTGVEPGTVDLLTGEDLCAAPWYFDLGWLAGELVELQWHSDSEPGRWNDLLAALFDGYGRDLGADWARVVALRILLHLHDYTAYVAWLPHEFAKYLDFLGYLIDPSSSGGSADPAISA